MMHLIFCLRHAAQALTLRDMPGSLLSAPLLIVLVVLSVLLGTGRGATGFSSKDGRTFFGEGAWIEEW